MRLAKFVMFIIVVALTAPACSGKKNRKDEVEAVEPEQKGPTANGLYITGNKKLNKRQWKAAIASYEESVEVNGKPFWQAEMNRGIALSRLAKFDLALSAFESALRNGGEEHWIVYYNLGNLYQDRGMYSAAIDAYRATLHVKQSDDVDTLVNIGACYVFLRNWTSAEQTYNYLQQIAPDDARPVHGLALIKQLNDQYRDAAEMYDQAHRIDPKYALSYFNQARCYENMQEWAKAEVAVAEFIRLQPNSPFIGRARGMQKRYKKKMEEGG